MAKWADRMFVDLVQGLVRADAAIQQAAAYDPNKSSPQLMVWWLRDTQLGQRLFEPRHRIEDRSAAIQPREEVQRRRRLSCDKRRRGPVHHIRGRGPGREAADQQLDECILNRTIHAGVCSRSGKMILLQLGSRRFRWSVQRDF